MISILKIIAINLILLGLWYVFNLIWRFIFCRPKVTPDGGIKMNLPHIAESFQIIRFLGYPLFFFFILFSTSWYMCIFLIYPAYINAQDIYDIFRSRNDYLILHKDYIEYKDDSKKVRINPNFVSMYQSESLRPTLRKSDNKWHLRVYPIEKELGTEYLDLECMNLSGYVHHIKKKCAYFYGDKFSIND